MEKDFRRHIQQVYCEISYLGLSAKLSRLSTLEKFQHSVSFSEALLALELLFRLCDQFHCTDIPELFELFYIYEYWDRREHAIFTPPSLAPDFQIGENAVTCTLASSPSKGCLACTHFDACHFPRAITPDDLSNADWRCINCGNPLEFPAILYQKWLTHAHNVKIQFLCCICFMEYSAVEEGRKELGWSEYPLVAETLRPLPADSHFSPVVFHPTSMNFKDLIAITLGFLAILSAQFEDPRFALYHKVPHPVPQDEIAWEAMQIARSQMSRTSFTYLAQILPRALVSPRLDALFEYCFNFLEPEDLIFLEDTNDLVFNFSYKFRDLMYTLMKTPHVANIIARLQVDQTSWDEINAWVASRFI